MATKTIQTKEDIRRKMVDVFGNAFPTIKSLVNYPMIVMNTQKGLTQNLHWMWFLPDGQAISYGEKGQNRFIFHPKVTEPVCGANLDITDAIDAIATYGDNKTTFLSVQKLTYTRKDKTITDTVMVVTLPDTEIAEISKLYTKIYDIKETVSI